MGQTKLVPTGFDAVQSSERIISIDALRGFDMFWVSVGGPFLMEFCKLFSNPLLLWLERQFYHAEWVGFPGADLVMPLFLFIVGVVMPFSIGKRLERGDSRGSIYSKVIYRVAVLWILGMVAQGHLLSFDLNRIIKHIFSSSMVLWAGGRCLLLLALFYWVIDVLGYRRWAFFFIVFGMNAIVAYLAPFFIPFADISNNVLAGLAGHLGKFGDCLLAAGVVGILWLGLYYMYRKQTFVRI